MKNDASEVELVSDFQSIYYYCNSVHETFFFPHRFEVFFRKTERKSHFIFKPIAVLLYIYIIYIYHNMYLLHSA